MLFIKINKKKIFIFSCVNVCYFLFLLIAFSSQNAFQSKDFSNNIILLKADNLDLTKGLFYGLYSIFLRHVFDEIFYLLILWSLIPTILVLISMLTLRWDFGKVGSIFVRVVILIILLHLSFGKYYIYGQDIPTGHLLFQSVSSAFFCIALLLKHRLKTSSFLFFVAISLHYVSGVYLVFYIITKILHRRKILLRNLIISKSGIFMHFIILLVVILLSFAFVEVFYVFRGAPDVYDFGVDDGLKYVLYDSFILTSAAYFIFANIKKILNKYNLSSFSVINNLDALLFFLLMISLFSLIVSYENLGLAYRLNYIVFVLSPYLIALMFSSMLVWLIKLIVPQRKFLSAKASS